MSTPIKVIQGDTKPDIVLVLYDKAQNTDYSGAYGFGAVSSTSSKSGVPATPDAVTGALDLSDSTTSILVKFRLRDSATNIFSIFSRKISDGSDGAVWFEWPFFALDVADGRYELEITILWGIRSQTSLDKVPFTVKKQFGRGGRIADDENAAFVDGKLYFRNTETGSINGMSLTGAATSSMTAGDSGALEEEYSPYTGTIYVKVINGGLCSLNEDTDEWHYIVVRGTNDNPHFVIGEEVVQIDSADDRLIAITTVKGLCYFKNLDTNKWHSVNMTGSNASPTFTIGTGVTL